MLAGSSCPLLLLLLPCCLARPGGGGGLLVDMAKEGEVVVDMAEDEGSSWFSLVSSLAGVVLRTGEAVAEVVDREGGLRESLGGDNVTQVVSDSVQSLLLLVPQIKANISQAIGMVPQVQSSLTSRLSSLPSTEELQQTAAGLLDTLPDYSVVDDLRSSVQSGLASLPTREEVVEGLQSAFALIPEADKVNNNIDTAVNVISPLFEKENELGEEPVIMS